ncbi:MAG TPA: thiamine phosphate synthase [Dehalococcoidia bacterium]|nr:thiamine phosphate synthase [Dehalococcoidia bacterium]
MTRTTVPVPLLMLVTDAARLRGRSLESVVDAAVGGGVNAVQLRERELPHDELTALATRLRAAIGGRALLLVNGDGSAARASGADGVHLPEAGASIAETRRRAGETMLISRAVHGMDAAVAAVRDGADMLVLGTVFASASHAGAATIGVEGVRAVCASVRAPVIAIGGVTAGNARDVVRAGAAGVAVIGAIFGATDARLAAAELRAAISLPVRA